MSAKKANPTPLPILESPNKIITEAAYYPETEIVGKGGIKVLDTSVNLKYMLDRFNAVLKNNTMSRKWEIEIPGYYINPEDPENYGILQIKDLATVNLMPHMSTKTVAEHVKLIAEKNNYHPIKDCLEQKPWDGTPRLDRFIATLRTAEPDLSYQLIKTWMCSGIAAIYLPDGIACQGVLVLQGAQNIGKTTWIKNLDPINCNAVLEGKSFDSINKDDLMAVLSYWIVEFGELDSTFKRDIARLKAFITASKDHYRYPYGIKGSAYSRRTIFAASVNSDAYLVDDTGNRRWWTIPVESIEFDHGIDMQQVWAEVYVEWKGGHPTKLSAATVKNLNERNLKFEKKDSLKEKLLRSYDWTNPYTRELTATEVLEELGYKPNDKDFSPTKCGIRLKEITGDAGRMLRGVMIYPVPCLLIRK